MNEWYVIQTKALRENDVCAQLKRAEFEVFNPKISRFVAGVSGQKTRLLPLFPSYIFARMDFLNGNVYRLVKYTRGVNKILGNARTPVPIPKKIIELIKSRANRDDVVEKMLYKPGDTIRVKRGLLKDIDGILENEVSAEGRVRVLLQIMQRQVRTEINCSDLERLH